MGCDFSLQLTHRIFPTTGLPKQSTIRIDQRRIGLVR